MKYQSSGIYSSQEDYLYRSMLNFDPWTWPHGHDLNKLEFKALSLVVRKSSF